MPARLPCDDRPMACRIDAGGSHAALPSLLCAGLLTRDTLTLHNLPHDLAADSLQRQADSLGLSAHLDRGALTLTAAPELRPLADTPDARLAFAAALSRYGRALRAGDRQDCALLTALQTMGAAVTATSRHIEATASRLQGARLTLPPEAPDTLTAALLLAAVLADGETVLQNASQAPEIVDLALCLTRMGATIYGIGTGILTVQGVDRLAGTTHRLMPDRRETLALLCAALLSHSHLVVHGTDPQAMAPELDRLVAAGATVVAGTDWISLDIKRRAHAITVPFGPYPAASATMLPIWLALAVCADGCTTLTGLPLSAPAVDALAELGASVAVQGDTLRVTGVSRPRVGGVSIADADTAVLAMLAGLAYDSTTDAEPVPALPQRLAMLRQVLTKRGG